MLCGLIVPGGDLLDRKKKREKGFASGRIVPGDLPDRKKKREKGFASGRIVPGDLPDRKKKLEEFLKWFHFSRRPAR